MSLLAGSVSTGAFTVDNATLPQKETLRAMKFNWPFIVFLIAALVASVFMVSMIWFAIKAVLIMTGGR